MQAQPSRRVSGSDIVGPSRRCVSSRSSICWRKDLSSISEWLATAREVFIRAKWRCGGTVAHQLSSVAAICLACIASRDKLFAFRSSRYVSRTPSSSLWYWTNRVTEESVGASGVRASVAAHASVLSLKGSVLGLSMVEERLQVSAP